MKALTAIVLAFTLTIGVGAKAETIVVIDAITKAKIDMYLSLPKASGKKGPPIEDQCKRIIPALMPIMDYEFYNGGEQGYYNSVRSILNLPHEQVGPVSGNFLQLAMQVMPLAWEYKTFNRSKFETAFISYCNKNIRTAIPESGLYHYTAMMSMPNGEHQVPWMKEQFVQVQAEVEARRK